jgi:hypothetical protein
MTPLRFALLLSTLAIQITSVFAGAANEDLDRYVGGYTFLLRNVTLSIVRDGDRLIARPSNGMPSATLKAQAEPGHFSMVGASFDFHFIADASGKVLSIEMTEPDGRKRKFSRLFDARAAAAPLRALAVDAETSVNAHVYNRYERIKGPDGRFKTETYAFGNGGFQSNSPIADKSIDTVTFDEIALLIAPAFTPQGYVPATDPETTNLLVMIYWGATASDEHPAVIAEEMFDPASHVFRDQINRVNARILGFRDEIKAAPNLPGSLGSRRNDLILDLEESRYWIALVALDFQTARLEKKIKPLWSVRYNLPSRGTNFRTALPQMTQIASHYLGRDSKGLVNRATTDPQGKVELGEQKVIGVESTK